MISNVALDRFQSYVDDVLHGDAIVSEAVRAAVVRHTEDLKRQDAADFPYIFDAKHAARVIGFFPIACKHSIGEFQGLPFELENWQAFIVGSLFGWKRIDGTRRFRKAYISVARKNGKSTLISALVHFLAMADINPKTGKPESVAEIVLTATKKDQASVVFNEAKRMRMQSPEISRISNVKYNQINYTHNEASIRISSSERPLSGLNPHAVIMDELHEWRTQHTKFYDTMVTGFASRMQPLHINITTAGDDSSELWEKEYDYAIEVVHGRHIDNNLFVFSAELDKDDDPFDECNWIKANPNLGVSVKLDYLREQANREKTTLVGQNRFTRFHGNRKVTAVQKAFDIQAWDNCAGELSDWSTADCICYAADIGGRDDLASVGAVARWTIGYAENERGDDEPQYRYECKQQAFICTETQRDLTTQPWATWLHEDRIKQAKWVITTLVKSMQESMEADNATQFAYDRWNASQLAEQLEQDGLTPIDFKQSCAMYNEPIREFLDCVSKGTIRHNGDPVLRWAVNNMTICKNSEDQWKPDRKSSKDKIDPIVAVLMAFRLAMIQPARASGSALIT